SHAHSKKTVAGSISTPQSSTIGPEWSSPRSENWIGSMFPGRRTSSLPPRPAAGSIQYFQLPGKPMGSLTPRAILKADSGSTCCDQTASAGKGMVRSVACILLHDPVALLDDVQRDGEAHVLRLSGCPTLLCVL